MDWVGWMDQLYYRTMGESVIGGQGVSLQRAGIIIILSFIILVHGYRTSGE
jgi:hypothetical protein